MVSKVLKKQINESNLESRELRLESVYSASRTTGTAFNSPANIWLETQRKRKKGTQKNAAELLTESPVTSSSQDFSKLS